MRLPLNLHSRLNMVVLLLTLLALLLQALFLPEHLLSTVIICVAAIMLALLLHWAVAPLNSEIKALNLHAQNLQDGSFNTSANQLKVHQLKALAQSLNLMSSQLRTERATLYQRELLLDTVLQSSPTALILTDDNDTVLMSNTAAWQLLHQGKKFDGSKLSAITGNEPVLANAFTNRLQGLLRLQNSEQTIWHLAVSQFQLNQKQHWLYLLKPLTREIQREELNAWKKLLRVIGHELNNTLAPLSSLAFSGAQLAKRHQDDDLNRLFHSVAERCQHLNHFVQAYIHFAKVPPPVPETINWPRLINQLQDHYEFELIGNLPAKPWQADPAQLSQLLLNLLKNAHETGCAAQLISLSFTEQPHQLVVNIQDCGGGMSADAMQHALIPFYTTKSQGSGIGLTLCRDIAEAHGGQLLVANHAGGLLVQVMLPGRAQQ